MQRDVDDAIEYGEDAVVSFESLFELNVLVPERVSQEVQANTLCSAIEESVVIVLVL